MVAAEEVDQEGQGPGLTEEGTDPDQDQETEGGLTPESKSTHAAEDDPPADPSHHPEAEGRHQAGVEVRSKEIKQEVKSK